MNALRLSDDYRSALRQMLMTYNFVDVAANIAGLTDIGAAGTVQAGAILRKTSTTTANTEAGIRGTSKVHLVAQNKPHTLSTLVNLTQANTDNLKVAVGFSSIDADLVTDANALAANLTGAGLFSLSGQTYWSAFVSKGTEQRITLLDENGAVRRNPGGFPVGAGAQSIEIKLQPKTATLADVVISINGVPAMKYNDWDFSGSVAVAPYVSVKGGSTTAETLDIWMLQHALVR